MSRTVYCYQARPRDDGPIIDLLVTLAERYPRYGFGKLYQMIRRSGHKWNHKRIYRVYCSLKMNLRRKGKKRLPSRNPQPLAVPDYANDCWSIDFMSDVLNSGQRFRTFNVMDDYNRECLAIEVDTNLPAVRVIRVLNRISAWRGYPLKIRLDNGPEFISLAIAEWAEDHRVELEFIQPGKPTQNSYVERFNRTYREEVLDLYVFTRLQPVMEVKKTDAISHGNETILFVDDEESIADMTGKMLQKLGYEAVTKTNPAEALELFQSNPDRFGLIITDMTMPQMNGAELLAKLKEVSPDIPVILCTGHSSLIDEEKAKASGIASYITKPIVKRDIAIIIREVLDQKKSLT